VVHDLDWGFMTLRYPNKGNASQLIEESCDWLGVRHERPARLLDVCLDLKEEFGSENQFISSNLITLNRSDRPLPPPQTHPA